MVSYGTFTALAAQPDAVDGSFEWKGGRWNFDIYGIAERSYGATVVERAAAADAWIEGGLLIGEDQLSCLVPFATLDAEIVAEAARRAYRVLSAGRDPQRLKISL